MVSREYEIAMPPYIFCTLALNKIGTINDVDIDVVNAQLNLTKGTTKLFKEKRQEEEKFKLTRGQNVKELGISREKIRRGGE
jgi:hypothetical protein